MYISIFDILSAVLDFMLDVADKLIKDIITPGLELVTSIIKGCLKIIKELWDK